MANFLFLPFIYLFSLLIRTNCKKMKRPGKSITFGGELITSFQKSRHNTHFPTRNLVRQNASSDPRNMGWAWVCGDPAVLWDQVALGHERLGLSLGRPCTSVGIGAVLLCHLDLVSSPWAAGRVSFPPTSNVI